MEHTPEFDVMRISRIAGDNLFGVYSFGIVPDIFEFLFFRCRWSFADISLISDEIFQVVKIGVVYI